MRPARILVNRLWPLFLAMIAAAALSFVWAQIAAIAAGFGVIWALSWRHQDAAVTAVEERDGVTFYVASTSAVGPMKLVRTPGLRGICRRFLAAPRSWKAGAGVPSGVQTSHTAMAGASRRAFSVAVLRSASAV